MRLNRLLIAAVLFVPVLMEAQVARVRPPGEVSVDEARCRRLPPMTGRAKLDADVDQAIRQFALCPDVGGDLLAAQWRTAPPDSAFLLRLTIVSQDFVDARVARAAMEVVDAKSSPMEVKCAALQVLGSQLEPRARPIVAGFITQELWALGPPRRKTGEVRIVATSGDRRAESFSPGKDPVDSASRAEIAAFLARIASDSTAGDAKLVAGEVLAIVRRRQQDR